MRSKAILWLPLGLAAAVFGLLPWLVHGGGLPLQNLAAGSDPSYRPFVLLPFSQYAISTLAALLVVGGAVGGFAGRLLPGGTTWRSRALLLLGVLVVQIVAIVQTTSVVGAELQLRPESTVYLALLVAGSIVSALLGAVVLMLVSASSRAAVVVGVALTAALAASWVDTVISSPGSLVEGPRWPFAVAEWIAPIAIGVAVGWSGIGTIARVAAAVFGAVVVWVGPALVTGITSATGTRVYARYPAEMLRYGVGVFTMALGSLEIVLPALLVAAAIATVGIVVRRQTARRGAVDRVRGA